MEVSNFSNQELGRKFKQIEKELENHRVRLRVLEKQMRRVGSLCRLSEEIGDAYLADPFHYAKDETDHKIIETLLNHRVMTSPELTKEIGMDPKKHRWMVGHRLKRMEKESKQNDEQWLEYRGGKIEGPDGRLYFRAWWLKPENIMQDIRAQYDLKTLEVVEEEAIS